MHRHGRSVSFSLKSPIVIEVSDPNGEQLPDVWMESDSDSEEDGEAGDDRGCKREAKCLPSKTSGKA
jgi:hypothetical protein